MTISELMKTDALPPTVSVAEASELVGISLRSTYRAIERGDLPVLRFGRSLRVPSAPLLAMLGLSTEDDGRG